MSSILSRSSGRETLANIARQKLLREKQQIDILDNYPLSTEADFIKAWKDSESQRDEVQLEKLAKRKDAVDFNTTELVNLGEEEVIIQGDKISITKRDTGEKLFELKRRGNIFVLKTPSRKEALKEMANVGMVKQTKGIPVAMIKKEELFSTLRKALKGYDKTK